MFIIFSLIYGKSRKGRGEENKGELRADGIERSKLVSVRRLLQKHIIITHLSCKSISLFASLIFLSALTASADRMTGGLFVISLITYSFSVVRTKMSFL
jgi:hypothetical protein